MARAVTAQALREYRLHLGLTQAQAAAGAGVSLPSVQNWEAGALPVRHSYALPRYIAYLGARFEEGS